MGGDGLGQQPLYRRRFVPFLVGPCLGLIGQARSALARVSARSARACSVSARASAATRAASAYSARRSAASAHSFAKANTFPEAFGDAFPDLRGLQPLDRHQRPDISAIPRLPSPSLALHQLDRAFAPDATDLRQFGVGDPSSFPEAFPGQIPDPIPDAFHRGQPRGLRLPAIGRRRAGARAMTQRSGEGRRRHVVSCHRGRVERARRTDGAGRRLARVAGAQRGTARGCGRSVNTAAVEQPLPPAGPGLSQTQICPAPPYFVLVCWDLDDTSMSAA